MQGQTLQVPRMQFVNCTYSYKPLYQGRLDNRNILECCQWQIHRGGNAGGAISECGCCQRLNR